MKQYDASTLSDSALNQLIREDQITEILISGCMGERYIGTGLRDKSLTIKNGIPGNALGAYLDGGTIRVFSNGQDAIGDTMNDGAIIIHGSTGDATGYAMRGGRIFIKDNVGYRAGIHMKAYIDKSPVLIVGGVAGSFLGEYQAGGCIIVLGLGQESSDDPIVGYFCGTGMHGGKMFLRTDTLPPDLPPQVLVSVADQDDLMEIEKDLTDYCREFDLDKEAILQHNFFVLTPNTKNPYKRLYTLN